MPRSFGVKLNITTVGAVVQSTGGGLLGTDTGKRREEAHVCMLAECDCVECGMVRENHSTVLVSGITGSSFVRRHMMQRNTQPRKMLQDKEVGSEEIFSPNSVC